MAGEEVRWRDPGTRALVLRRVLREMAEDHMVLIARALAFSAFLAIPSVLLLTVGSLTLWAGPATIDDAVAGLHDVMPADMRHLLLDGLHRLDRQTSTSLLVSLAGLVLALASTTSAMTQYMTALDIAFDRTDGRSFVQRRLVALKLVACLAVAMALLGGFLIFGPAVEAQVGDAIGHERAVSVLWWTLQWPVIVAALLGAFAALLYLGPDVEERRLRLASPGAIAATVVWLVASGGLALYTAHFNTYNRAWGSLSAVIVVQVWLWLTSLALLFGAELDSELEHEVR